MDFIEKIRNFKRKYFEKKEIQRAVWLINFEQLDGYRLPAKVDKSGCNCHCSCNTCVLDLNLVTWVYPPSTPTEEERHALLQKYYTPGKRYQKPIPYCNKCGLIIDDEETCLYRK